jgi:ABC-type bacteriocin/lantibiotic exporter with double-glycine peptidase domain
LGFRRLLRDVPLLELNAKSMGAYITVAGDQISRVSRLTLVIGNAIIPSSMAVIYFLGIFALSKSFGLFVSCYLLIVAFFLSKILKRIRRLGFQLDECSKHVNSTFVDAVNSVASIRSLNSAETVSMKYRDLLKEHLNYQKEAENQQANSKLLPVFLLVLGLLIGTILLWFISPGSLSKDNVIYAVGMAFLLLRLFPALGQSLAALMAILSDMSAAEDVWAFIGTGLYETNKADESMAHENISSGQASELKLKSLSFSYPNSDIKIFDALSFKFRPGRIYGISGSSGKGKSTLGQILAGLIAPDTGEVVLGSPIDSREHKPKAGDVLLVTQTAAIMTGSYRFNLTLGYPASDAALQRVLWLSDIEHLVNGSPGGLDYELRYQGSNLSGGQKQRLALARALLRDPKVLILDEVTNGLDKKSRDNVMLRLIEEYKQKILIFISHDDEILNFCDEIISFNSFGVEFNERRTVSSHP